MAKPLSKPAVIRKAIRTGAIPGHVEVSRGGDVTWTNGDLEYSAWVDRGRGYGRTHLLEWGVNVGDAKFAEAMANYGRMAVRLRDLDTGPPVRPHPTVEKGIPWPSASDIDILETIFVGLRAAIGFVHDRRDLATILATESEVVRRPVKAWQGPNNYPARLLQALVIARDLNEQPLIDDILEKLVADRKIPVNEELSISFQASVRDWAKRFSKALGFSIPLDPPDQTKDGR